MNALLVVSLFLTGLAVYLALRLRKAEARVESLSRTDMVTGAASRNAFYDMTGREISRSRRYKHPFTVAYMDIDNLKMVNYRFGYGKGDELLGLVAQTIKNNMRDVDVVARLGGDEFALLMPETGPEGAQIALSRLRTRLVESLGSRKMPVTFSFGAATFLKAPDSAEEAVKKAGVQMYSAKNAGANSIDQEVFGGEE